MAVRNISLLLTILYITNLALSAPTSKNTTLRPSTIFTPSQPPPEQIPGATPKRHHLIRVSKTPNQETSNPTNYFFDTTTLEFLETSHHTDPIPVLTSSSKDKVVVIVLDDKNDNILTSYHVRENPIDTFSVRHGRQQEMLCRRLRRCGQRVLEQRLGLLIVGVSLALAVVCACMREMCALQEDESLEPESAAIEEGMASVPNREKH
ncbi:hypothetical protein CCMA1212_007167 [Trichoderma ghanense]|uniref:SSCRP protein n=1 Tax=Trichoderma ghanense TaxID=65468 RepID=A0ABY2GXG6_9HYPO